MDVASSQVTGFITLEHRCGIQNCRTRRYRRDATDGHVYCRYGHQQPDALETQIEDDELAQSQQIKTTKRKAGQTDEDEAGLAGGKPTTQRFLEGRAAAELCMECFQLVLRQQIWWLVNRKRIDKEIEGVVKALWTLRLELHDRWVSEHLNEREGEQTLFSSQHQSQPQLSGPLDLGISTKVKAEPPRWEDILCLLYLGLVILRAPVTIRDIIAWTADPEFPYLNPERHIPRKALHRLDINWRRRLYLRSRSVEPSLLYRKTLQLAVFFANPATSLPGFDFPELNWRVLLTKHVMTLSLPLSTYTSVESLVRILEVSMTYPTSKTPHDELPLALNPELRLMSLVVLSVKLMHPFDDVTRHPYTNANAACLVQNWDLWNKQHASLPRMLLQPHANKTRDEKDHWEVKPTDIPLMDSEQVDDYLDWFERTLLPSTETDDPTEGATTDFDRDLYRLFPLKRPGNEDGQGKQKADDISKEVLEEREYIAQRERNKVITAGLIVREAIPREEGDRDAGEQERVSKGKAKSKSTKQQDIVRPCDQIKEWKDIDDVEPKAQIFVERCAHLAAIDAKTLVKLVGSFERKLRHMTEAQEKQERKAKREAARAEIESTP